jgi:hypothetical protein
LPNRLRQFTAQVINSFAAPLHQLTAGFIDPIYLRRQATRLSGLAEIDDDRIRTPLQLLTQSYRDDHNLTFVGRMIASQMLINLLVNRRRISEFQRRDPGVAEEIVQRPLIVVGLPRSGTTLLFNLLTLDKSCRALRFWETCCPVSPAIGNRPDHRIREAKRLVARLHASLPEMTTIHPIDPTGPEECTGLLLNTFCTPYFRGALPLYRKWLFSQSAELRRTLYNEYALQLKILQRNQPDTRWVLKSPSHLWGLSELHETIPSARVVYLLRDESESIGSLCSLSRALDSLSYYRVDPHEIGRRTLEIAANLVAGGQRALKSIPADKILLVRFDDLIRDPIQVVRHIYQNFDLDWSGQFEMDVRAWLDRAKAKPQRQHVYSLADYGLTSDDLRILRVSP